MDNDIDLVVFNMNEPGNIKRVIFGEQIWEQLYLTKQNHTNKKERIYDKSQLLKKAK